MGPRLGAGHAEGGGIRDGAAPAARGIVACAGAGRGGGPDDPRPRVKESVLCCQTTGLNPPYHPDDFSRPALRHGSLNSLFLVS